MGRAEETSPSALAVSGMLPTAGQASTHLAMVQRRRWWELELALKNALNEQGWRHRSDRAAFPGRFPRLGLAPSASGAKAAVLCHWAPLSASEPPQRLHAEPSDTSSRLARAVVGACGCRERLAMEPGLRQTLSCRSISSRSDACSSCVACKPLFSLCFQSDLYSSTDMLMFDSGPAGS